MYKHCHRAVVLTLALTAAPAWASTTSEQERLAYHHVRRGTVDCCMDAVIDRYATTKSPIRWMPFIGTRGWATYHCRSGTWTIDETMLRHTLGNVRDDVRAAGYHMVDWEAFSDHPYPCDPATDPAQNVRDRIARMEEVADIVGYWLHQEFGRGPGSSPVSAWGLAWNRNRTSSLTREV